MKKIIKLTSLFILSMFIIINSVLAKESVLPEENTVYFEDVVNTGKDNGYSKKMILQKMTHIMDGN